MSFEQDLRKYFKSIKGTEEEKRSYEHDYFMELSANLIEDKIKNIPVSNLQDLKTFYDFLMSEQLLKVQELKKESCLDKESETEVYRCLTSSPKNKDGFICINCVSINKAFELLFGVKQS